MTGEAHSRCTCSAPRGTRSSGGCQVQESINGRWLAAKRLATIIAGNIRRRPVQYRWQYVVFMLAVSIEDGEGLRRESMRKSVSRALEDSGVPTPSIRRVVTGASWSDVVGGPSTHPELPPNVAPYVLGEVLQFVVDHGDWVWQGAIGGVLGNRLDAAFMKSMRKARLEKRTRTAPPLDRNSAEIRAKAALASSYPSDIHDQLYDHCLRVQSEGVDPSGSWHFSFRNYNTTNQDGEFQYIPDRWLYRAIVQATNSSGGRRNRRDASEVSSGLIQVVVARDDLGTQ